MKTYEVVMSTRRDGRPCALLTYDPANEGFAGKIAEWAEEKDVPALFAPFMETREVPTKWATRWIEDRIIPAERQNLGEILRAYNLDSYDILALLDRTQGRSASDDYYVRPVCESEASFTDYKVELGQAIRGARKEVGMSQATLAEATGLEQTYISALENGKGNPTAETLDSLARGMGRRLSVSFL